MLYDPKWDIKADKRVAVLRAWIDAMRSGEYKQCHGTVLDDRGRMCAVGLLLHVSGEAMYAGGDAISHLAVPNYTGANTLLRPIETEVSTIWGMNDQARMTFPKIADYVEKKLRVLA